MSKIPFLWQKHLGNRRGLGHLLSYSNIGKNRQNTFICFEDAGRNALTHGQIRPKDRGKLIVFQNVWFSGPELSLVMASFASSFFLLNVVAIVIFTVFQHLVEVLGHGGKIHFTACPSGATRLRSQIYSTGLRMMMATTWSSIEVQKGSGESGQWQSS